MNTDTNRRGSCMLAAGTSTPARARQFVSSVLELWGVDADCFDIPLVTSELVTNAVRHAAGEVGVSIELDADRIRLEVSDLSPSRPVMRARAGARGGWGLHIVERLSSSWGLDCRADGKTVWCEIQRPAA